MEKYNISKLEFKYLKAESMDPLTNIKDTLRLNLEQFVDRDTYMTLEDK